jgi:hypothetical protein
VTGENKGFVRTGADTPLIDRLREVPTFFTDGVQGATLSQQVAKMNLIEDFLDPSDNIVKRRMVAVIVLPREQLKKVGELMIKMADEVVPENLDE